MAARSSGSNVRRLAVAAIALGATSLLLAMAPSLPAAWLAAPFAGAAGTAFAITANSTLQLNASPAFRGRVMALYTVVFIGSTPIGGPIAGWVGEHLSPRIGLGGGAVIAILAGVLVMTSMRRRKVEVSRPA